MSAGDPYTTITERTFVARFLLDPDVDTADTVANVDAFVDLPDGSTWALTICTVDEVCRLLARWKETGEVANGSYCWAADQLIVPEPGVSAMTAAIRELVRSGDITSAGIRCEVQGQAVSEATQSKPALPVHPSARHRSEFSSAEGRSTADDGDDGHDVRGRRSAPTRRRWPPPTAPAQ